MRDEDHLRAVFLLQLRLEVFDLAAVKIFPAQYREGTRFQHVLPAVPAAKAQKHVGAHHDADLRPRVLLQQGVHRVGGVALALAPQFHVGDLRPRDVSEGEAAEFQPLLGAGAVRLQLLVGRSIGWDDEELVGLQRLAGCAGGLGVADVRRVEAAAVDGDSHFFLSFTSSIFGSFSLRL